MRMERKGCPECGAFGAETRREMADWRSDGVVEVRTCECGAEWENHYTLSHQEVTHEP